MIQATNRIPLLRSEEEDHDVLFLVFSSPKITPAPLLSLLMSNSENPQIFAVAVA